MCNQKRLVCILSAVGLGTHHDYSFSDFRAFSGFGVRRGAHRTVLQELKRSVGRLDCRARLSGCERLSQARDRVERSRIPPPGRIGPAANRLVSLQHRGRATQKRAGGGLALHRLSLGSAPLEEKAPQTDLWPANYPAVAFLRRRRIATAPARPA